MSYILASIHSAGECAGEDGEISVVKAFGVALGIGLLFLLIPFIAQRMHSPSSGNELALNLAPAAQAIAVTVPKLCADYHGDEIAADARYKGKRLVVEGQVASVDQGLFDNEFLLLSTFGEFEAVHADIRAEYQSAAARLGKGQLITLDCEGAGIVMGNPFLMNCKIPELAEERVAMPTLLFTEPAVYSSEARRNKLQGSVDITLLVDENGNPKNVKVVHALGQGLDESAVEAVKHYRFKPAVDENTGRAVPARMSIRLQFHLN